MSVMEPPLRQVDCDGLEAHPGPSPAKRPGIEDDDTISMIRAGAKISQYSHVSASDQARQHIGDVFHGPVTLQNVAAISATATVPTRNDERKELMDSLVFKEMDARFVDVHSHLVGTCEWLSATPEYRTWMDPKMISTHHGFFWIKGKAGVGKSILLKYASMRAEAQCSARQHVLNFFFHARGGSFETSTNGLFRSLLHQLLEKVPAVHESLDKRRLGLAERQGWSSTLLKDTFREAVLSLDQDQVTCYIDAMDECAHQDIEHIIQYFDNLGDAFVAKGKPFYVCLSSRHYPNLRSNKSVGLILESQHGHDKDIQHYIRQRLMIDGNDRKQNLAELIVSRAHGVFLWVVLVVALVNQDDRNGNAKEIYQRLGQIPTGLSDLFNELIGRGTNSDYLRPLLQWVALSSRPLTPTELFTILTPGALKTDLEPPTFNENDLAKFILSASKGLVETTSGPWPTVQFIHESLRTYFLGEGASHLVDRADVERARGDSARSGVHMQDLAAMTATCHDQLKERCLCYLMQTGKILGLQPSMTGDKKPRRREMIVKIYPFLEYAVHGVIKHATTALGLGLTQQNFIDAMSWNELYILQGIVDMNWCLWPEPPNPHLWYKVYVVAKFAGPKLLKVVFETQPNFEADRWQWGVIIYACIEASDDESLSVVLEAGADPNAPSPTRSGQCLQHAVDRTSSCEYKATAAPPRCWHIVELLLKLGARPYATIESTHDCLYETSGNNELMATRVLLGEHLKADIRCSRYGLSLARAVGQASRLGNDEILRFLLDKGAETGWWSQATLHTPAHQDAFFEVTFEDSSILRRILLEGARVPPSTKLRSGIVLSGFLKDSTSVTMHFKQGSL